MNQWETKNSINKKLSRYHGEEPEKVTGTPNKYSSYAEAKQAGDVKAMIAFKRANNSAALRELSVEYSKLSISEIQRRLRSSEETLAKAKDIVTRLEEQEYNRIKKEFSRIGGLVGDRLEGAVAEALQDYFRKNEEYLDAVSDYNSIKTENRALRNAKEIFVSDHADLIEEERKKAQREDLRASGLLAELGIASQDEV